ncbi:hypothetical protein TRIP_B200703 [uncultured Desulfatiglans sp.]|nr:hypothetical protein TRIP_B200703 [uncultured Desulfatiglans sp.]
MRRQPDRHVLPNQRWQGCPVPWCLRNSLSGPWVPPRLRGLNLRGRLRCWHVERWPVSMRHTGDAHPEMVFLANLGVNLHVCLCGDLQVASAQTLDFIDISQKSSFPGWKLSPTAKSFPDGNKLRFRLQSASIFRRARRKLLRIPCDRAVRRLGDPFEHPRVEPLVGRVKGVPVEDAEKALGSEP